MTLRAGSISVQYTDYENAHLSQSFFLVLGHILLTETFDANLRLTENLVVAFIFSNYAFSVSGTSTCNATVLFAELHWLPVTDGV